MATLRQCEHISRDALVVVSPPAVRLQKIAGQADCRWIGRLPEQFDRSRYWCQAGEILADEFDECWVLRAGTLLPEYWQRRLVLTDPHCVALFPLSVRHPCTSVFSSTRHQPGLGLAELDRWLNRYLSGMSWDIPVFDGQTALLRPGRLPRGATDDSELAALVQQQGGTLVASDNLLIDDRGLAPASLPEDLPPAWQTAIMRRHPLTGLRHALTELSSRAELPTAEVPRVQSSRLHISHSWGGGLGRWVEDFIAADNDHRSFVLRPIGDLTGFGQTLALYSASNLTVPIRTWTLAEPILSTAIAHHEYRQLVASILAEFAIESVILSSLIGHAIDILRVELPVVVVCHDFYPFCPPILATWETPCSQCDTARLQDCLQNNPGHKFFRHEQAPHWLALRAAFIRTLVARDITLVAPSASVAARMRSLVPELREHAMQVIAHGLPQPILDSLIAINPEPVSQRDSQPRLRIIVLGSLETHKGASLLQAVIEPLAEFATVVLLGCGEGGSSFADLPQVEIIDGYAREELGALLAAARPDIGLLLSVVPETFSYTLSELHAAGVPVAATAVGAFADRIRHGENGWLYAPDAGVLLEQLRRLAANPEEVIRVRATLAATRPRTAAEMVAEYDQLFPPSDVFLPRPLESAAVRDTAGSRNIKINPEASFRDVFREFWDYARQKVHNTEKLPRGLTRALLWLMKVLYR